jgi:hypothetical protein
VTVPLVPDTEFGAKTWAKAEPLLAALGGRVFFAVPEGSPTFPLVTVSQISGSIENYVPIDHPRLTFEVWDLTKRGAADLKRALITALWRVNNVQLDASTFCYNVDDITSLWLPDNEARLARYVVDATFHVRA